MLERSRRQAWSAPARVAVALLPLLAIACAGAAPAPASAAACTDGRSTAASWPEKLDHPSTPESHRRAVDALFEATHVREMLQVALDNTIKVQLEANPKIRPLESVMRKFMAKYLSLDGIREPMSKLYMDRFSELEIVQLTAFYRTPLGQRTLAELPKILEEGSQIGMRLVQDHMGELKDMIREQLERGRSSQDGALPGR